MISLKHKIVVTIDGYSSCGKSSFAKLIAVELNYVYVDSGAMYRAVALYAIRKELVNENKINIDKLSAHLPEIQIRFITHKAENYTFLNSENVEKEIRTIEVSSVASEISKIAQIREHLVQMQQYMGKKKGIVMDGRDIGTVVFPKAEVKIFMKADITVCAKRRYTELKVKGIHASLDEISRNIKERDEQDSNREISPLRQAEDAVVLDNSHMTFDEQMIWFRQLLFQKNLLAPTS